MSREELAKKWISYAVGVVLGRFKPGVPGALGRGRFSEERAGKVKTLRVAMDNGARRALIPLENKRHFLEVSGDIIERVDPIFYSDPMTAAMKALGMG